PEGRLAPRDLLGGVRQGHADGAQPRDRFWRVARRAAPPWSQLVPPHRLLHRAQYMSAGAVAPDAACGWLGGGAHGPAASGIDGVRLPVYGDGGLGGGSMTRATSGQVQTVLGAIAAEAMGVALPHEHLLIDFKVMFAEPPAASDKGRAWE